MPIKLFAADRDALKANASVQVARYRSAPSTTAPIVRAIGKGETLLLRGRSDDAQWVTIGREGDLWVHVSHLDIEGEIKALPVIEYSLS